MRFSTWSRVAGIILAICMLSFLAIAQTTETGGLAEYQDDRAPYYVELDRLVEMFSQIIDQVRDTYYAASQGCNSQTSEALKLNAQATLNLLEGSDSPLFDDSIEVPLYATIGLLPVVNAFEFADGWFDPDVTSTTQRRHLELAHANVQGMMEFISADLQDILEEGTSFSEAQTAMADVCRMSSFLILKIQEFLHDHGYEVWCSQNASIQDAIDGAREGATIYIQPFAHVESIVIDKSIVLSGSPAFATSAFEAGRQSYGASIESESGGIAVHIIGERPIQVILENLVIKNAAEAVVVEGNAVLQMKMMSLVDSDVAIAAYDAARVTLLDSYVERNGIAMLLGNDSSISVEDSYIQSNADVDGCIQLTGHAALELSRTEVSDNSGHGVVADDSAELVITGSLVLGNAGDGIRLLGSSQLIMNQTVCSENAGFGVHAVTADCPSADTPAGSIFTGSVLGAGNVYPESTDSSGNHLGGLCPAGLFD